MDSDAIHPVDRPEARLSAVVLNVALVFPYPVMPLLIGGAADARGYEDSQLGLISAAFMGGFALVNLLGILWVRRYDWKALTKLASIAAALSLAVPIFLPGFGILLGALFIAGIAGGMVVGLTLASLGDTREPEVNFAWAWVLQMVVGITVSYSLPRLVAAEQMLNVTLGFLACFALIAMPFIRWLPRTGRKSASATSSTSSVAPSSASIVLVGLMVIVLVFIAEGGVWTFFERIGNAKGFGREFIGTVIATQFIGATIGSLSAALTGTRFGRVGPVTVAVTGCIVSVVIFQLGTGSAAFLIGGFLYGWAWNYGSPYRMALVADADVTGRFVTMIPAMQAMGAAIGPALAGFVIVGGSFLYVYVAASLAWMSALALFIWANQELHSLRRASDPATPKEA